MTKPLNPLEAGSMLATSNMHPPTGNVVTTMAVQAAEGDHKCAQETGHPATTDEPGLAALRDTTPLSDQRRLNYTEQLLDQHYDRVYRYAYHFVGCAHAAEDIAQEVFFRAMRSVHQLRSLEAAGGWLLTIARNESTRWCQKQRLTLNLDQEPIQSTSGDNQLDQREWVQQALSQLPADYRCVVLMFYFEQKSYAEIAAELDLPIGTVMSRLSRGRSHLKQSLIALAAPNRLELTPDAGACNDFASEYMNKESS